MSTIQELLTRGHVAIPDAMEGLAAQVIEDAKQKLGYRRNADQAINRKHGRQLQEVLRTLDIAPFTPASVARYQAALATPRKLWLARVLHAPLAAALLIGAALIPNVYVSGLAIFVTLAGAAVAIAPLWAPGFQARWVNNDLSSTPVEIPLFALQTALALKEALPYAGLTVERFVSRPEARMIARNAAMERRRAAAYDDPFLVVSYGDYTAYVEVWDEAGFEQARKV